jgi:LmbE family N-acetylglucosaminyl deacetylase
MIRIERVIRAVVLAALASLAAAVALPLAAQQAAQTPAIPASQLDSIPLPEPSEIALPLPEDRGAAALEQSLKRLSTTASVMMIVAHPDDEDGPLLTYLSRGLGARVTLLTLNRGEGGQNAISADADDALGLMRTNELLRADEFYGAKQLWGTEADFGFSKTQEESYAKWGHDRVLYDAVLAVRRERPQVIVSTFVGGVSDGHGHHQVSGEIAQEVFKAAADPTVFPDQLKDGLQPWQPLAVYSMVPFAPITEKGIFDYATGKWAPARFKNYVTGEWTEGALSADVTIPVGTLDPALGRSYVQIARQGWGEQKSQNGGANPALSGPAVTRYHLWSVREIATLNPKIRSTDWSLWGNEKVFFDPSLKYLGWMAGPHPDEWLTSELRSIDSELNVLFRKCIRENLYGNKIENATELSSIYKRVITLREKLQASKLGPEAKYNLLFEIDLKIKEFQEALAIMLELDAVAFRTHAAKVEGEGPRGGSADETEPSVMQGENFRVRTHTLAPKEVNLTHTTFDPSDWAQGKAIAAAGDGGDFRGDVARDEIYQLTVPADAKPTAPCFTRPTIEQPYYDLSTPDCRLRSFVRWPLMAWFEFDFNGLPIRVGRVVQTLHRVSGMGGVYEPLVVTPAIGLHIDPEARILPLDGSALPVRVTVHAQAAAEGAVTLNLPAGWTAQPAEVRFHLASAGDTEPLVFSVTTDGAMTGAYTIQAIAHSGGHEYKTGWQSIGYPGLRPYNQYKPAQLKTRKIDVKLAPGLRIGYVMGTGDRVPEAIEGLSVTPHLLTSAELASGDLSAWNVIVLGIRAYSARPELAAAQPRLDEFVRRGGTLIVQYQSGNFPAPFPLSMGRMAERVVDEQAPVKLLEPANSLLRWPNEIGAADFDGWVEERGHSFLDSWDKSYTPLTETADPGQDPQRGGLLVAHPGKGTYIYAAYALYRQLPELVPGSYRLLANLLSAGQSSALRVDQTQALRP